MHHPTDSGALAGTRNSSRKEGLIITRRSNREREEGGREKREGEREKYNRRDREGGG